MIAVILCSRTDISLFFSPGIFDCEYVAKLAQWATVRTGAAQSHGRPKKLFTVIIMASKKNESESVKLKNNIKVKNYLLIINLY